MATIITQYSTTSSAVTTIALAMKSYCLRLRTENAALQFGQEEKRWSGNQGLTPILPWKIEETCSIIWEQRIFPSFKYSWERAISEMRPGYIRLPDTLESKGILVVKDTLCIHLKSWSNIVEKRGEVKGLGLGRWWTDRSSGWGERRRILWVNDWREEDFIC